ncbi:hypothetical protein L2E82_06717 [Cichorium intybus]|uniref:Uncharacterized protein n=1 Tax=Cichorium intybus TaxID=13427 RepID=A0ACB9HBV5_CICIN|nr:hypothetical protein L2E82_06717 [Cichorium intybus]
MTSVCLPPLLMVPPNMISSSSQSDLEANLFKLMERRGYGQEYINRLRILMGTDVVKNVNKNNASHAILFEALALVMHLESEKELMSQCVALLGKFIPVREPNIQYLGLYLATADFAMREELVLKAAILAEKFAPDLSWYVDVILQLIDKAGDFVSDAIWSRVVQFVINNEDLQPYAALKAREYLDKPAIHETMVKEISGDVGDEGAVWKEESELTGSQPGCGSHGNEEGGGKGWFWKRRKPKKEAEESLEQLETEGSI